MNNGSVTAAFLAVIDAATKREILQNIATHYGISTEEAHAEVTDQEAESLLDYVTGQMRAAVSLTMRRHGLAA